MKCLTSLLPPPLIIQVFFVSISSAITHLALKNATISRSNTHLSFINSKVYNICNNNKIYSNKLCLFH